MKARIDSILNLPVLLLLNLFIIILTETVGNGAFFFETGIIHGIAILFILLAVIRSLVHYYTFDPAFERFVHFSIAALGIFAFSHVFEFVSFEILHEYQDAVFANVANFYAISLLFPVIGEEVFFRGYTKGVTRRMKWLIALIGVFVALILTFTIWHERVSLEPDSPIVYLYNIALIVVGIFAMKSIYKIRQGVRFPKAFPNYWLVSVVLIVAAAFTNVGYEILEDVLHIPEFQIVYISHFLFYLALSFMFLAFAALSDLPGIAGEVNHVIDTSIQADKPKSRLSRKKR